MAGTYDPSKITLSIMGFLVTAYAPGTFVTVKRNKDQKELTIGAGGEDSWTNILDKSGDMEFVVLQTSLDNDVLTGMVAKDETDNSQIGPCVLADLLGTTLCSTVGRIIKYPDVVYAAGQEARKWLVRGGQMAMVVGGNPT